ncbi:MAG TPA: lysylphosphatidylglycerol synthase transmembrane domain-containing protein [Terriglobales bacterium]|jgi:uncharacterized protein (TIRG00374 family)
MNKKRTLVTLIVVVVLGLLVYLQVHAWKTFEWKKFWDSTSNIYWPYVGGGILLTYFAYVLRAVRWRIFLKPMRETTTRRMLAPQFIGFAGLALLGRPGEMIRPYLIARKENVTFSSQVGVWVMERVFDMGAVAIMFVLVGFWGDPLWGKLMNRRLAYEVRLSAVIFFVAILAVVAVAIKLRRSGYEIAERLEKRFERRSATFAHALRGKIVSFTDGLQIISDAGSFVQLAALSMGMWFVVAGAYWLITHAYPGVLAEMHLGSILLLMVAAMFGSLLQLPGVGGGSQLATINLLSSHRVFGVPSEIAVSCGMLIWLCTFMSVIPVGLLLAHREKLSLRAVAKDEAKAEAALAE